MNPIIQSLLDQDLYKLTMQQAFYHQHSGVWARYVFRCRNHSLRGAELERQINEQLDALCSLRYTEMELAYLAGIRFFKADFIDFLRLFQLSRHHIRVTTVDGEIQIVAEGPIHLVSPFEVFVLALINELCNRYIDFAPDSYLRKQAWDDLHKKVEFLNANPFRLTDFGTRRRYSKKWQEYVVSTLWADGGENFVGTSNVHLARRYKLKPIGTMAHEWVCLYQGLVHPLESQRAALQGWVDEYRADLGIALSDTLGFAKFLQDFDGYFAKLYDGVRHDSGDPFGWAHKMINHYDHLGIDPRTKQLVFSDGLTMKKAAEIQRTYGDMAMLSFGIGTHLTNDIPGVTPLQVVMKLTQVNGRPVAKLSDSPGKGMCEDSAYQAWLQGAVA